MGIQTKLFADGTRVLLSRNGKSTVMQVLDACGNIVKTRCKSINTRTVPVCTDAPVRMSIGFKPQKLRSHENDLTRLQIGFRLSGQKAKRFKTDAPRNKLITTTKTDFDESFNVVNASNMQRWYDHNGVPSGTVPIGVSTNMQIADLNQQQIQLLRKSMERHNVTVQNYSSQLDELDKMIGEWNATTAKQSEIVELRKQLLEINQAEKLGCFDAVLVSEAHKKYWFDEVAPVIAKSHFSEYAKMNPCEQGEILIREKLDKLLKEEEMLKKALLKEQSVINERMQMIEPVIQQRGMFAEVLESIKSHGTIMENKTRKTLCDLQRKITSIISGTSPNMA